VNYPACNIKENDCGLNIIFETMGTKFNKEAYESGNLIKKNDKPYTDNALIIQSVLEYSNKIGVQNRFTLEKLTEYLVKPDQIKCEVFELIYSENMAKTRLVTRIAQQVDKIDAILRKLVYLELIEILDDEQNQCIEYLFTHLGQMIGALLLFKKNKLNDKSELVDKIVDFYDSVNRLSAKFFSIFVRKCNNHIKVFDQVTDLLFSSLELAPSEKVASLYQIKTMNPLLTKESWSILEETFREFEKINTLEYDILFYNLKLIIERVHEIKSENFKGFEELRQLVSGDPFAMTIEGYCKECNMFTPCVINIIQYFRSYVDSNTENNNTHLNVKCPSRNCKNGLLDFEFIEDINIIRDISNVKIVKRGEKFHVNVFENQLDNLGTIFERNTKGDFSLRSKRLQRILIFLYDNPEKYFRTRTLFKEILKLDPTTLFKVNKKGGTAAKNVSPENFHYQFQSLLNYFNFIGIVEFREVRGNKTKGMVKEYKLTQFGKIISLLAKSYSCNSNENNYKLYNEIHQTWRVEFESPPVSSLDIFCKEYFSKCKEKGFFGDILNRYKDSLLSKKNYLQSYNKIDLYCQIILPVVDYIESIDNEKEKKNTKLWKLWYQSLMNLDEKTGKKFLLHIKLYLTRQIEKSVHQFDRYELERFDNRFNTSYVTIEAICTNCFRWYFYLSIPVITYVGYLFQPREDELFAACKDRLKKDIEDLQCNECGTRILDLTIV
jgi:hypothetical protein